MAVEKGPENQRPTSVFSNGSNSTGRGSKSAVLQGGSRELRPLPASRDGALHPHQRATSIELRPSRSEQFLRQGWPVSSTASPPGEAVGPLPSTPNSPLSQSPFSPQSFTSSIDQSAEVKPLGIRQVSHTSYKHQSLQGLSSSRPHSAFLPDLQNGGVLMGRPWTTDAMHERPSSPASRAAAGLDRGSRGSSPGRGSDRSRPVTPAESKLTKKKGWISTKLQSRSEDASKGTHEPYAWVESPQGRRPYDVSCLVKGQPVSELWDINGDTFVHLFAPELRLSPSFKINSVLLSSSRVLSSLLQEAPFPSRGRPISSQTAQLQGQSLHKHMRHVSLEPSPLALASVTQEPPEWRRSSLSHTDSNGRSNDTRTTGNIMQDPRSELHLYMPDFAKENEGGMPLTLEDTEKLIAIYNLFSFLMKGFLLGTPKRPSFLSIFQNLAEQLRQYDFTNLDGSTYGEVPNASFECYVKDLRLDDVRLSRQKTIEAIALGEWMKSWELYNEGFAHGVGKWGDLLQLEHPSFSSISNITRARMEKASRDLSTRIRSVCSRLDDFEFPSLFAGVAASSAQSKNADFKAWKASFASMRKYTMALYKSRYGSWPPRAKSRKNIFEESGLNRLVLQEVYQDFSHIYDMLVDRTSLTTRSMELLSHNEVYSADPQMDALRKLLGEYDRSSPPVQPPTPFDLPLVPDLSSTRRNFSELPDKKKVKERNKRLKDDEINMALMQSYNRDAVKVTPFIEAFVAFERSAAHGKTMQEIVELRIGQWIFLYVLLQSLPLLVVDAPGLKWTSGVEYFLCEVPKGSPPWVRDDTGRKLGYYRSAAGSIVTLPPDVVDHGVEGIYRRSHCWQAAERWIGHEEAGIESRPQTSPRPLSTTLSPFPHNATGQALPPPPFTDSENIPGSGTSSPSRPSSRSSMAFGLEALPLPLGVMQQSLNSASRSSSAPDPTKSFDNILGRASVPENRRR
ncbi:hypothetical protein MMC13_007803 [Lambiella insularis]|nr:hypothetical protein [Lambiella insularis]